jgi:raffinose/stachyose/melibiose transport system permease protein
MKRKYRFPLEILGIFLALIWLAPFYLMLVNSFKTKREIFSNTLRLPKSFNLDNYKEAFERLDFVQTFFNSLIITFFSVVIIILFSSMAAYALSRTKSKISTIIFYVLVASMLIPFQSVMIPLITILGNSKC